MVFFVGAALLAGILNSPKAQSGSQNILNSFVSTLTQMTMSSLQQCLTNVQFSQTVQLKCNVPDTVAIAFINSTACQQCAVQAASTPTISCDPFCRACIQTGFDQSATFTVNTDCITSSDQSAAIKNTLDQSVDQAISSSQGVISQMLNILPDIRALTSSPPQLSNSTNLSTAIKNLVSVSNVQSLITNISQSQTIQITSTGGSSQGAVTQNLLFYSTSQLIATNLQQIGVTNAVTLAATQGITESSGTSSDTWIIVAVVGALLIVGLLLMRFFK